MIHLANIQLFQQHIHLRHAVGAVSMAFVGKRDFLRLMAVLMIGNWDCAWWLFTVGIGFSGDNFWSISCPSLTVLNCFSDFWHWPFRNLQKSHLKPIKQVSLFSSMTAHASHVYFQQTIHPSIKSDFKKLNIHSISHQMMMISRDDYQKLLKEFTLYMQHKGTRKNSSNGVEHKQDHWVIAQQLRSKRDKEAGWNWKKENFWACGIF